MQFVRKLKLLFTGVALVPCLLVEAQQQTTTPAEQAGLKEARQYLTGIGKRKDRAKALTLYTALAQKGSGAAMNITGIFYKDGLGVPKDRGTAIKWFTKATHAGVPEAWYNLGLIYKNDSEGGQDYKKAFECFSNGARLGHLRSTFMAGYSLYKGLGVQQDYSKAVSYFRKGASRTEPRSQYFLGLCLRNGYGANGNEDSARYWLNKSAAQKFRMATNELKIPKPENGNIIAKKRAGQIQAGFGGRKGLPAYRVFDQRAKSNLPEGRYTGSLIRYDWSGQHAVGTESLVMDVAMQNDDVIISWTEADSIRTQLNAKFASGSLEFKKNGSRYGRFDHYAQRRAEEYEFQKASLHWARKGDTVFLQGNIQLWSVSRHEPAKPVYISVAKVVSRDASGRTGFRSFPNPFTDQLTVQFDLGSAAEVNVQLLSMDGKAVYEKREGLLTKGNYTFPIQTRQLPAGTYVLRVLAGNDTRITQVVKR